MVINDDNDVYDVHDDCDNTDDEYDNDYENLSTWQRARQLCETQPSILRHPLEVPILLSNNFHHHHPGNVYVGAETSQVPRPSYTSELGNLTMPRHTNIGSLVIFYLTIRTVNIIITITTKCLPDQAMLMLVPRPTLAPHSVLPPVPG